MDKKSLAIVLGFSLMHALPLYEVKGATVKGQSFSVKLISHASRISGTVKFFKSAIFCQCVNLMYLYAMLFGLDK
jgi:hypothetical protein